MRYIYKLHKICKDNLELIENYDKAVKDDFHGWVLHHRLELTIDGEEVHTPESLIRLNMYYNRPYFELIFLKRGEHIALHNKGKKDKFTEERRRKISESLSGRSMSAEHCRKMTELFKGENNPFYGKHHSEETRRKWSEIRKGITLSEETRRKLSDSLKGRISPMKGKTISAETRKKLSESHKGKVPWNKGKRLSSIN